MCSRQGMGITLMLLAALCTCTAQLFWKLYADQGNFFQFAAGFALYGAGAILMLYGLRFGEFSVLHPMQGSGYIWSIILGAIVLHEAVSAAKIAGIAVILLGLILLSLPERE